MCFEALVLCVLVTLARDLVSRGVARKAIETLTVVGFVV